MLNNIGIYYSILKNYQEMEKYHIMSVNLGNINSMVSLINYYKQIKNYPEMIKYCIMGLNLGNSNSMNTLVWYYENIDIDYPKMEKYYIMSTKLGNTDSMVNLGWYFQLKDINYKKMKKYWKMGANLGNIECISELGNYYRDHENYTEMKKYYLMGVKLGDYCIMGDLGDYYGDIAEDYVEMEKYYLMAIEESKSDFVPAMISLGNYHRDVTKNIDKMKEYYLMAIDLDGKYSIEELSEYYNGNDIDFFNFLYDLNKNEVILKKMKELLKNNEVKKSINLKIRYMKNTNTIIDDLYKNFVSKGIQSTIHPSNFKIISVSSGSQNGIDPLCGSEQKEYFIHSTILDSEYFKVIFEEKFKTVNEVHMYVNDFQTISDLLKFLYLKELDFQNIGSAKKSDIEKQRIQNLLKLSDEFMFVELKKLCEFYLLF